MSQPAPATTPFPWATMMLVAVLSAGLGALGAWNFLPREKSAPITPITSAPAPTGNATDATASAPSPTPPLLRDALSLGNWYYDHSQWADAIRAYEQAIATGIDNADVRTDLGNSYRFSDQPQKALEQYRRAQTMDARHENSFFNEAALYANVLHDHAKAAAAAQKFIERFPESASVPAARQLMIKTD